MDYISLNYLLVFWLWKRSLRESPFNLFRPSNKPPINPELVRTALIWKGEKWKIKVVGTINIRRRDAPNLCLNPDMKSIDPEIKQIIAISNKNGDKVGGIFLLIITSTVFSKFSILPGIE